MEELKKMLALIPPDTAINRARRRAIIILINKLAGEKHES